MFRIVSCLVMSLLLCSCATNVILYENGKRSPNHAINFLTMDQKLHITYFIESHKQINVDDESMYWPSTFPPHENKWIDDSIKKVTVTLRVINHKNEHIKILYNNLLYHNSEQLWDTSIIYEGKLPYKEFVIPIKIKKGETKIWFDIYRDEKLYCFTREIKFRY